MYLFILESLGTQELILIGLIALIVFGPRKLPEMARKLGSYMTEFKKLSGDFKSTWSEAIELENPNKPLEKTEKEIEKINNIQSELNSSSENSALPEVKKIDKEYFDKLVQQKIEEKKSVKTAKSEWL